MTRLPRFLKVLIRAFVAIVALVVLAIAVIWLNAPGRFGLEGAEERAAAWKDGPRLRDLADRAGVRFGSAVMVRDLEGDPAYGPVLAREFNSVTPFVDMKWGTIHPERERYDFERADQLVDFAEAHGMRVRGHTLVYGQVVDPPNPEYLSALTNPGELRALMEDHIRTVAGRYAGRVETWDVVNEPLVPFGDRSRGDGLAQHVFSQVLGPGYIGEALRLARQADPGARLFLNEFGVLQPGPKQERYYRLVKELREEGAPLDGVGFQGHVLPLLGNPDPTREQIETTLRHFAELGVQVEITELNVFTRTARDVLTLGFGYDEAAALARQAKVYATVTQACLAVPECRGVTLWTFTDRYPTTVETLTHLEDIPLIFDNDYRPKPAAFALRETLARAAPRPGQTEPAAPEE
ncbi:MAG: endo-1,4-beta-xylanase [Acidobacteria bacterium]|jgi:endo-1,4-beta-xylanase|nr:endo-1,4-beta-xylanase [Acidobacteriota bacterium]